VGRYQVEAEIARGGMGEVWRARDLDLGRPLALKVLQQRHGGDPELVRRFREEAQVTGQLQHPGIPPVHEVGTLPDGRPFLAMKLIRGQTLEALLAQRPSPAAELPRFLAVFEQVAQTLAYAHSRGVIHRDLKPANVMVGAFGEVQVMDWGLAKVLGAGEREEETAEASVIATGRVGDTGTWSLAGDVLGTPAYMAPEQARGEVGSLDERCDVFGLGAVLCVLLTGQPPFRGGSGGEAKARAARGDLAEAFARLDACGADEELVRLARRCLAPEKADRPRDAQEVSSAIAAYLGGVQQRLREAERQRAAAEARAEESAARAMAEGRARRLLLGLAALLLLVLGLGTGGAVYWQQQRQWAHKQAEAGLAQAAQLRQGYRFADAEAMLEQVRGWARQAADARLQQRWSGRTGIYGWRATWTRYGRRRRCSSRASGTPAGRGPCTRRCWHGMG
jgi:serine/threonine-protein kinase